MALEEDVKAGYARAAMALEENVKAGYTGRTKSEWMTTAHHCFDAYLYAPKYSPMRLLFLWGEKYARKRAANAPE